jgi:hypothetical protein
MKHNASPMELIRFAEWVLFNYKNSWQSKLLCYTVILKIWKE